MIPALREHFRLVVPSLPGYGWSGGRAGTADMGDAFHRLMGSLGHEQYLVAGGDWGAHIGSYMGHAYPEAVRALHLNMMPLRLPARFRTRKPPRARRWRSGHARRAATSRSWAPSRRRSRTGCSTRRSG